MRSLIVENHPATMLGKEVVIPKRLSNFENYYCIYHK